jgi:hypothetical protein
MSVPLLTYHPPNIRQPNHNLSLSLPFSLRTRSVIYPPPRVLANELVKGPQFLVQVTIVLAPRVGLSRDGLRQLASSREWEIRRDQAALYSPGGRHIHRNWV